LAQQNQDGWGGGGHKKWLPLDSGKRTKIVRYAIGKDYEKEVKNLGASVDFGARPPARVGGLGGGIMPV